jgi:rhodanese-related sulfurtransferase
MKRHILVAAVLVVSVFQPRYPNAQDAGKPAQIAAAALSNFVKAHSGPVLDVRMLGDCDENRSLKRTTNRIGYDFGPDNPDGKKMAHDMFMSKIQTSQNLVAAKKAGKTVLVVCCAGGRSEAAAMLLASNGFKVAHVPGGLQNDGLPTRLLKPTK